MKLYSVSTKLMSADMYTPTMHRPAIPLRLFEYLDYTVFISALEYYIQVLRVVGTVFRLPWWLCLCSMTLHFIENHVYLSSVHLTPAFHTFHASCLI